MNARDGLFNRLPNPAAKRALEAELQAAPEIEAGALQARFDLVLA